jgi:hypothetical protein
MVALYCSWAASLVHADTFFLLHESADFECFQLLGHATSLPWPALEATHYKERAG